MGMKLMLMPYIAVYEIDVICQYGYELILILSYVSIWDWAK